MLVPVLTGLVAVTLLLVVGLGDGTRSRTQTRTAADAAALAAAGIWRHELDLTYRPVIAQSGGWEKALLQLLANDAAQTLAAATAVKAQDAAATFAAQNGATLTSFDYVVTPGGVQYRVSTRSLTTAKGSEVYTNAEAVASVRLLSGLCYVDDGTRLGLVLQGVCIDPWSGRPPAVLPGRLPGTLPNPFQPAVLDEVTELVR